MKFRRGTVKERRRRTLPSAAIKKAECIYLRLREALVTPLRRHVCHEEAACVTSKRYASSFPFLSFTISPPSSPTHPPFVLFATFPGNGRNSRNRARGTGATRHQIHRDRLSRGLTNTTARVNTLFFLHSYLPSRRLSLKLPSDYLPPVRTVEIPSWLTAGSSIRRETGRMTSRSWKKAPNRSSACGELHSAIDQSERCEVMRERRGSACNFTAECSAVLDTIHV